MYATGKDLHGTIRTGIVLTEPVHAGALRKAADLAIKRYPYFSVKLVRRGEEYVMIHNDAPLPITDGGRAIPLGGPESNGHLFALAYDNKRLYIDTSHFVTDGNGKFPFIKTLLYCYLHIIHPDAEFDTSGIAMPGSGVPFDEADDYPFPDKPFNVKPLGSDYHHDEIFIFDDQPQGYENRDLWTSFRIKAHQKDMMKYASSGTEAPQRLLHQ